MITNTSRFQRSQCWHLIESGFCCGWIWFPRWLDGHVHDKDYRRWIFVAKVTPGSRSRSWHLRCAPHSLWQCHHVASYSIVCGLLGNYWFHHNMRVYAEYFHYATTLMGSQHKLLMQNISIGFKFQTPGLVFLFLCARSSWRSLRLRDTMAGVIQAFLIISTHNGRVQTAFNHHLC